MMAASKVDSCIVDDADSEGDADEDGWEECDDEPYHVEVLCLFCTQLFCNPVDVLVHCQNVHAFSILDVKDRQQLDCISYIKLINFLRQKKPNVDVCKRFWPNGQEPWQSDDFMKPQIEDDPLLTFDFEDLPFELLKNHFNNDHLEMKSDTDQETIAFTTLEYNQLITRLKTAEDQLAITEDALQASVSDLNTLRNLMKKTIFTNGEIAPSGDGHIQRLTSNEDEFYFESYGHFSIHEEMLKDKVRTESYRDCILGNADLFRDKVVLDIGCGSGILSMFAAKAGAKMVIGVDQSEIIWNAIDIIRENQLQDKITLIKGKMEDVQLPVSKVDIIISEWMGYFLLFESMLDTVLYARNQYLDENGLLLPNHCSLHLAGIQDEDMNRKRFEFWDDVYGFKMSCMKKAVAAEVDVSLINKDTVITESSIVKDFKMETIEIKDLDFSESFTLTAKKEGYLTALVGYFDVHFHCPSKVSFSTSPFSQPTHWKQAVFLLESHIPLKNGEVLSGQLTCKKNIKDPRSLIISIKLSGQTLIYQMQ